MRLRVAISHVVDDRLEPTSILKTCALLVNPPGFGYSNNLVEYLWQRRPLFPCGQGMLLA